EGKKLEIIEDDERDFPSITWYKITATDILEEQDWPGKWIPIIEVVGNETDIEGKVRRSGLIRNMKAPQLMYNYNRHCALDTPIPTPDGWKLMGDLHAGDKVFDNLGAVCSVLGESPVYGDLDCYRVTFDDGSSIVASGVHEWCVEERGVRKAKTWDWRDKT